MKPATFTKSSLRDRFAHFIDRLPREQAVDQLPGELNHDQAQRVLSVLRALLLIENSAAFFVDHDSYEETDKLRSAICGSAAAAILDLERAFNYQWVPDPSPVPARAHRTARKGVR